VAALTMAGIYLHDAQTGAELRYIEPPEHEMLEMVTVSPDGSTVASMHSRFEQVRLWDTATGQTRHLLDPRPGAEAVDALAFSAEGDFLAIGGCGQPIRLFDVETGKQIRTFEGGSEGLRFSFDDQRLISIGCRNQPFPYTPMTVYDARNGHVVSAIDRPSGAYPSNILMSPDGKVFAIKGENEITILDARTGTTRHRLSDEEGPIYDVAFSPDGRILASYTIATSPDLQHRDYSLRMWDVEAGTISRTINKGMGTGFLGFSPDGSKLAGVTNRIWVLEIDSEDYARGFGEFRYYEKIAFQHEGNSLLTWGGDGPGQVWHLNPSFLYDDLSASRRSIVRVSPNGRLAFGSVYVAEEQKSFEGVWDMQTGKVLSTLQGESRSWRHIVFSPDNRRIARATYWDWSAGPGGGWINEIQVWDILSGSIPLTLSQRDLSSLAFSPDGSVLATGGSRTVKIIDAMTGMVLKEVYHPSDVRYLAFHPDGKLLASAGVTEIQLWDTSNYQLVRRIRIGANQLAFSPDGEVLASIGLHRYQDGYRCDPSMWEVSTGELVWSVDPGQVEYGTSCVMQFSPSGGILISSQRGGGPMQLWARSSGALLWSYATRIDWFPDHSISMSSDERYLAIVGMDGVVRVFGLNP
jgi:WD40 repeat protein